MNALTLDDVIVRNDAILAALAGKEVLAMSERSGDCYSIAGSGVMIWDAAAQPIAIRDICARLLRHYKIDEDTCRTQTLAYIETLVAEGLFLTEQPQS